MLLLPAIESLEVKGWILDSVEDVLNAAEPIPNLKCLLLPLGSVRHGYGIPAGYTDMDSTGTDKDSWFDTPDQTRIHIRQTRTRQAGLD